jgi:hypothetical protein
MTNDEFADIYVVVSENNLSGDGQGEIVFEQYVSTASLENAKIFASRVEPNYGKCRIAKLVFVDTGEK